jgi:hypothetical protein
VASTVYFSLSGGFHELSTPDEPKLLLSINRFHKGYRHMKLSGATKIFQRFSHQFVSAALAPFEKSTVSSFKGEQLPPLFIVGHSRSGTTLLYQLLCAHLELSYASNWVAATPSAPATAAYLARFFKGCDMEPLYTSSYGITVGWNQPSTAFSLWQKWFSDERGEMQKEAVTEDAAKQMISTINAISNIYERPFINKWTPNTSRIDYFAKQFPRASFILLKRNLLDVAQSQLQARLTLKNDPGIPFVTWPQEFENTKATDPVEGLCDHIILVEEHLNSSLEVLGSERFLVLHFEDVCADPRKSVERLREYFRIRHDISLPTRNLTTIPSRFPCSVGQVRISLPQYNAMADRLKLLSSGTE